MGEVVGQQDAFIWSINKISTAFGMDRRTITKRIQESGVKPAGKRSGHSVYHLKEAAGAVYGQGGPGPDLDLDQYPEARKAWYQSENEKLKFEVAKGELVTDSEYARALAFLIKSFTAALDVLPDQLERDAGLEPEAILIIQAVCDGARESTYQAVLKYTEAPDADDD